jgi:hypothetical protein
MSKPYYSEYVKHALRFYSRNCTEKPVFKSDADKSNWLSCDSVFKCCSPRTKEILLSVYSGYDTLPDEVYNASKKYKVDQNLIWDAMKDLEKRIARKRGLL